MEELEAEASTSPFRRRRDESEEAETDPRQSHPGPSSSKRPKLNSSAVHEEFVAYKFNDTNNKERVGSKCNHCNFPMRDKNTTNLKKHLERKHPEVYEKVKGGSLVSNNFPYYLFCFQIIPAADKEHQETLRKSIDQETGTSMVEKLFPPPEEAKGKIKGQVCHLNYLNLKKNSCLS